MKVCGKKTRIFARICLAAFTLCFFSCAKKAYEAEMATQSTFTTGGGYAKSAAKSVATADYANARADNGFVMEEAVAEKEDSFCTPQERKLIYTGNIDLEVSSLDSAKASIEEWVKRYGGYVASSSQYSRGLNYSVKIPSKNFAAAMDDGASIGSVRTKNISSQDVSDRYYDLQTRLNTRKLMQERLNEYLKSAKNVKDMLEIETKLNDVTSEVEAMQGQMNRLSNQIDYSQIDIFAQLPYNQNESGFILPDTRTEFRRFVSNIIGFFASFLFVVLYIIIYGIPILLVFALLYYIAWGKIGLVRKLFHKIKK